ncbi:hypothetical protein JHK84_052561 [Glycine max]|nr:hypothetical protein JHK84_052561 [Glycine max]
MVSVKQERKINSERRFKFVYYRRRKKMKLSRDVMESGFSPFPFDWTNVPRRMRTKRKSKFNGKEVLSEPKEAHSKPKEELSRPKRKLNSGVFDIYLKCVTDL